MAEEKGTFTPDERLHLMEMRQKLGALTENVLTEEDWSLVHRYLDSSTSEHGVSRDAFGLSNILTDMETALIVAQEMGTTRGSVLGVLLDSAVMRGDVTLEDIRRDFGDEVAGIMHGLLRIRDLYEKSAAIESENFRSLLVSMAEDMRVILIMIANRVCLMRNIKGTSNTEAQKKVSMEAAYLYAPLAHKLGLYKLKSELEDLSLKYLEHDAYYYIKEKLNATKKNRDAYIARFTKPIEEKLIKAGLKFHMKGRTKSIHSIWQKMKKQKVDIDGVYDLFAIRIIIDSAPEREKLDCWQAFSIITDMYQSNPGRMRDWLSVPKSNGYESLHITVLGPEQKWVEVQIRTERMDDIAEHGLAAHWRYKGIKQGEGGIDEWLANIRSALENNDDLQLMDQFTTDLKEDEVYVFTPKGDLLNFPKGATVLDFAYYIHSRIGNTCVGGKINGRAVSFRQELHSGDQIEILTQSNQKPRHEWLNIVQTSKAKAKIRLALKETQKKDGLYAKELIERRFKNRKIDIDESTMARIIKKMGYKENSDFYKDIAEEKLDVNTVIDRYVAERDHDLNLTNVTKTAESAANFEYENPTEELMKQSDDVLTIDENLKGIDFELAHCCHPIYGDPIFGFVTINKGIKIHRTDCPNAKELRRRFGYRIVKARWSGKGTSKYAITLRIIGNDDIGIVSNITNIISKEDKLVMRGINISSKDGLFSGNVTVMIDDAGKTEALIKKLSAVKGVKQVTRI